MYKFTSPPALNKEKGWKRITLSLPGDTSIPVPAGQWQRENGRIIATFTREELGPALFIAFDEKRRELEARLERGLQLMSGVDAHDGARADKLLAHWDTLNGEYDQVQRVLSLCREICKEETD